MLKRVCEILSLVLVVTACAACSSTYQIAGKTEVNSLDGRMLYLKSLRGSSWTAIDSTWVEHGFFTLDGNVDTVAVVTLNLGDENIMPIVLENGKINVSITNSDLRASGTPLNDELYRFISKRNDIARQLNGLDRKEAQMVLDGENIDTVRRKLAEESRTLQDEMNRYAETFIKNNYKNVLGPSVFIMLCSSMPYPMMTDQVNDIMRSAPVEFTENPLIKDFLDKAKENMRLLEEHQRLEQNVAEKRRAAANIEP